MNAWARLPLSARCGLSISGRISTSKVTVRSFLMQSVASVFALVLVIFGLAESAWSQETTQRRTGKQIAGSYEEPSETLKPILSLIEGSIPTIGDLEQRLSVTFTTSPGPTSRSAENSRMQSALRRVTYLVNPEYQGTSVHFWFYVNDGITDHDLPKRPCVRRSDLDVEMSKRWARTGTSTDVHGLLGFDRYVGDFGDTRLDLNVGPALKPGFSGDCLQDLFVRFNIPK